MSLRRERASLSLPIVQASGLRGTVLLLPLRRSFSGCAAWNWWQARCCRVHGGLASGKNPTLPFLLERDKKSLSSTLKPDVYNLCWEDAE